MATIKKLSNCAALSMSSFRGADRYAAYLSALGAFRRAQKQKPSNHSHCIPAHGTVNQLDWAR